MTDIPISAIKSALDSIDKKMQSKNEYIKELQDKLIAIRQLAYNASLIEATATPDDVIHACLKISF